MNPFAFGFTCHDLLFQAGLRLPTVFSFHTLYGEFVKRYQLLQPLSWLFVYASETETMGNVIPEAMACGSAVVASRAGGIPSLVVPGETALLYSPGNLQEAAEHTRWLLSDAQARNRLGIAARQCVEQWHWEHSIRHVRDSYAEAISRFGDNAIAWNLKHRLARASLSTLLAGFKALAPSGNRKIHTTYSVPMRNFHSDNVGSFSGRTSV